MKDAFEMGRILIDQRTNPRPSPVTSIERDDGDFVVPAEMLAEAFGITVDEIRENMRLARMTSRSEVGMGADEGRWRLTFYYRDRACRYVVDRDGVIIDRVRFPVPVWRFRPQQ